MAIRPSISTLLVIFFACLLVFLGLFAEVFESETPEIDLAQVYANPIPVDELQKLTSVQFTNKHGSFYFENSESSGNLEGPWQMTAPQSLRMKDDVIKKIVDALNVIRVRNFHRLEPINVSSFSLDNPTLSLTFQNLKGKTFELKMGLINPIDNSAYISLSTQNQIYQIDPIEIALEAWDLPQLVDSKILAFSVPDLLEVDVSGPGINDFKLLRKDEEWVDSMGVVLNPKKVQDFIARLLDLKSLSILENLTEDQLGSLQRTVATPVVNFKLVTRNGIRSYRIGEISGSVPGISLSGDAKYVFTNDERTSFSVLGKDQIRVFSLRLNELK
jgi:hypothetical protein